MHDAEAKGRGACEQQRAVTACEQLQLRRYRAMNLPMQRQHVVGDRSDEIERHGVSEDLGRADLDSFMQLVLQIYRRSD